MCILKQINKPILSFNIWFKISLGYIPSLCEHNWGLIRNYEETNAKTISKLKVLKGKNSELLAH